MLAFKKNGGVIRKYPMIPGIDLCGEIVESHNPNYSIGQKILATGFGIGVSHWRLCAICKIAIILDYALVKWTITQR